MSTIRSRVEAFGLKLPSPPAPRGAYAAAMTHDGIAYVSGQVSRIGNEAITGPVDEHTAPIIIREAAHACVLRALSAMAALEDEFFFDRLLSLRASSTPRRLSVGTPTFSTRHPNCSRTYWARQANMPDQRSEWRACPVRD